MRLLIKNKILNQCQITVSLFSSSGSIVQSTSRGRVRGPGPGNWEQGHIIHLAESRKGPATKSLNYQTPSLSTSH